MSADPDITGLSQLYKNFGNKLLRKYSTPNILLTYKVLYGYILSYRYSVFPLGLLGGRQSAPPLLLSP